MQLEQLAAKEKESLPAPGLFDLCRRTVLECMVDVATGYSDVSPV